MKKIYLLVAMGCMLSLVLPMYAQERESFEQYKNRKQADFQHYKEGHRKAFEDFRRKRNEEFAQFLRKDYQNLSITRIIRRKTLSKDTPIIFL